MSYLLSQTPVHHLSTPKAVPTIFQIWISNAKNPNPCEHPRRRRCATLLYLMIPLASCPHLPPRVALPGRLSSQSDRKPYLLLWRLLTNDMFHVCAFPRPTSPLACFPKSLGWVGLRQVSREGRKGGRLERG